MPSGPIHRTRSHGEGRWEGLGWRRRSIFGAIGVRPPLSDITAAETELILRHAGGFALGVELGVFEGGTAIRLGEAVGPGGELVLVDPYPPGKLLGINMSRVTARRAVGRGVDAKVRWLRQTSSEAARGWDEQIDFLRVDGVHTLEGVQRDWSDWSPWIRPGGNVAVRADVVSAAVAEADEMASGDEIVPWILAGSPGWELVGREATTAVLRLSA